MMKKPYDPEAHVEVRSCGGLGVRVSAICKPGGGGEF